MEQHEKRTVEALERIADHLQNLDMNGIDVWVRLKQ